MRILFLIISLFLFESQVFCQQVTLRHTSTAQFNLPDNQSGPKSFGGFINFVFDYDCWTNVLDLHSQLHTGFTVTGTKYQYRGKTYDLNEISQYDRRGLDGLSSIRIKSVSYIFKLSNVQYTKSNKWMEPQTSTALFDRPNRSYIDFTFDCDKYTGSKVREHVNSLGFTIIGISSAQFENTEVVEERIRNYIKIIESKQEYDNIIRDADLAFNSKDYTKAKQLYQKASDILKNEQYPINQIKKINDLITKEQENEQIKKYNNFIEKADAAFNQKDYSSARNFYTSALQLYPQESYPNTQIERINGILETQNKANSNSYSNSGNSSNSSNGQSNGGGNNSSNSYGSVNSSNQSGNQSASQNNGGTGKNNLSDKVMLQGVGYVQVYEQNGQYYMQREDGSSHVTSLEAYNSIHSTASKNKTIRDQNAKNQTDYNENLQKEIDPKYDYNEKLYLENQKRIDNFNKAADHLVSSFYTLQNINNLKTDVDANRTLGSNFTSIEEIEQAFNQKYSGLAVSMDNMHAEEQNLNLNTLNYMSTLEGDAGTTGTIVAGGLYLLNEFQNQKEKENALAELERQRSEALAKLEREKHQQLVDLRMEMLTTFPEGGIPLSSHKINVSEIYFFVYSLDESQLTGQQPIVLVSNVFPWKKYTDGTWPYRTALDAELKNKGLLNKTTLVGFYSSQEMAEEMRTAYLKLAEMGNMRVENIALVGKPLNSKGVTNSNTSNQTTDFWGGSTSSSSTNKQTDVKQNTDDFWGQPVKQEVGSATKGKTATQPLSAPEKNTNTEDDFWGAPVKQEPAKTNTTKPAPAKATTPTKNNHPTSTEKDFWGEPVKTSNEKKKP